MLNPVERVWSLVKYGNLANFVPEDLEHLEQMVVLSMQEAGVREAVMRAFFDHAGLPL